MLSGCEVFSAVRFLAGAPSMDSSAAAAAPSPIPGQLTAREVRAAVAIANVPTLLMVVFQFTGDEKWLNEPYLPTRGKGLGDHDSDGLAAGVQEEIRAAAGGAGLRSVG